jgi:uncharacterized membrane protein YdjX (TVP38/TMEM64 family)
VRRWVALAWPLAIVAAWGLLALVGVDPRSALAGPLAALDGSPWFAAGLLAAYLARAVVLLPATLLTVLAGFALGPAWGVAVATAGATASALLAYALARRTRTASGTQPRPAEGRVRRSLAGLGTRLREDAFAATLIARLALLPGDVVNVVAGASRVPWRPFAAATALGGAPGLVAAVLAGASLEGSLDAGAVQVDPRALAASALLALVTAGGAAWARRRSVRSPDGPAPRRARAARRPPR